MFKRGKNPLFELLLLLFVWDYSICIVLWLHLEEKDVNSTLISNRKHWLLLWFDQNTMKYWINIIAIEWNARNYSIHWNFNFLGNTKCYGIWFHCIEAIVATIKWNYYTNMVYLISFTHIIQSNTNNICFNRVCLCCQLWMHNALSQSK